MSKRSGFAVRITAFIEADPFNLLALRDADNALAEIAPWMIDKGFADVHVKFEGRHRYSAKQPKEQPIPVAETRVK